VKVVRMEVDWKPHLPIFASEPHLRGMGREFGWLGGIDDTGTVACLLPFVVIQKSMLRLVRFPVETILLRQNVDAEQERLFLNGAVQYLRGLKADVIVPATFNSLFRTFPDGAQVVPYANSIVDLTKSEEDLWQAVHHKHRNVIRNAGRKGVTVKCGTEHLEVAYQLTLASLSRSAHGPLDRHRLRTRLNYSEFRQGVERLGEYVRVMVAEYEGVPQCAAVIPYSQHTAYYLHGGSIGTPLTGASNLLQWEAIRMFRLMGVRHYNFFGVRVHPAPGSKAEGIRKFKERFGGDYVAGYMWKVPFGSLGYGIYQLAARLRSGGDVVDQERSLRRSMADPSPALLS
jgi:hypothetical protein